MKRYIILAAAMLTALACTKSEMAEKTESPAKEGVTVFSGALAPTSKISIGEKVSQGYKAYWEDGDVLDVIKVADGSSLGTATLTDGAGSADGKFELPGTIADGTTVRLVYGSEGVATDQAQAGAGASSFKDYAYAKSGDITVNNGKGEAATLVHQTAVVKVSVSAGAALQGATVSKLILRCIGGTLSGTDKDYVRVSLTTPLTLSGTAQDIWAVAAPYNASGKEIDVALVITKGGETYTLPIGFTGKAIEANKVSSFPLSNITDADCVAWYAPHDARLMPGPGYGYGAANCYLIQYKNATYTGATLSPDSNIPDHVDIDFRARGDFLKVDKPSDVTFEWVKKLGTSTTYNIQTANGGNNYVACDVNNYSIGTPSNYSVTITNTGALAGAPILSMKKNGTVIWAWTLWNISADGTRFGGDDISNGTHTWKLANMDIGQNTTQFTTWVANKAGTKPDLGYRTTFHYQWGRTTPVFWTSYASTNLTTPSGFNVPCIQGPLSIEEAITTPGVNIMTTENFVQGSAASAAMKNWSSESNGALWGGNTKGKADAIGEKSIYDPCPKGWRVADPGVYSALAGTITGVKTIIGAYYTYSSLAPNNYFTFPIRYGDTIASNGRISTMSGGDAGTNFRYSARWTNFVGDDSGVQPRAYTNNTDDASDNRLATFNKALAMPVRCVVDDENR